MIQRLSQTDGSSLKLEASGQLVALCRSVEVALVAVAATRQLEPRARLVQKTTRLNGRMDAAAARVVTSTNCWFASVTHC